MDLDQSPHSNNGLNVGAGLRTAIGVPADSPSQPEVRSHIARTFPDGLGQDGNKR